MTCELDVWRLFQHPSGNHHVGVQEESCAADIGWWKPAALFIYGSRSFVVFVFPPLLLRVSARTLVYRDNPAVGRVAIESRSPYLYYFRFDIGARRSVRRRGELKTRGRQMQLCRRSEDKT